ncbi:AAA family ATPase (plasmid) [Enterocloster clostridioformis]
MMRPLPVGVDDFEKIRSKGYYYVDKTLFIKELLDKKGEVNLFTRPRRFGKTLTLSMVRHFFEDTGEAVDNKRNQALFEGLQIMEQGAPYTQEMCSYPVINLSLKSSKQPTWELAYGCLKEAIGEEYLRHRNVMGALDTPEQKRRYEDVMNLRGSRQDFSTSIWFLSKSLYQHYGKKVIILIDEYDVPLENSYFSGFYDEMIGFIRSILESALKTNPYLEFAVISGCLRITKESIFTGLNNLEIISILNPTYSEYFGFTQKEIDKMLEYYGLSEQRGRIEAWYNGYLFGSIKVYNPWSVANYIKVLTADPEELPSPYWANTSSNSIVRRLIENADPSVKGELEVLLAGGTIEKPVHEEITYDSVYDSEDNLWNFLFFTGYLKLISRRLEGENRYITMGIPNLEVKYIYTNMIENWFAEKIKSRDLSSMYRSIQDGNAEAFEGELSRLLKESISYMDAKEAFYHGFLLGVLGNMSDYIVKSNRESGNGRLDIVIKSLDDSKPPVIMEIKVAETFKGLETACDKAIKQIEDKEYDSWVPEDGYTEVLNYGIAFFRKRCKIKVQRRQF